MKLIDVIFTFFRCLKSKTAEATSSGLLQNCFLTKTFISFQTISIGFKSGDLGGDFICYLQIHFFVELNLKYKNLCWITQVIPLFV